MEKPLPNYIIAKAIDLGLSSLGESGKQALWFYLINEGFTPENAPENIEGFVQALKNFFGLGYNFLDDILRHQLNQVTGKDLTSYSNFAECISGLKNQNKFLI